MVKQYKVIANYNQIGECLNTSGVQTTGREQGNKELDKTNKSLPATTKNWTCTKLQRNSKKPKPAECPFLHPHLRDPSKMKGDPNKSFIAEESGGILVDLPVK